MAFPRCERSTKNPPTPFGGVPPQGAQDRSRRFYMSEDAARIDVWLWRARFFKTRALAQRFVEDGKVRLTRAGQETRLDKSSRAIRPGDVLVFALGGRITAIRVEALGDRRGPAQEARSLYAPLDDASAQGSH